MVTPHPTDTPGQIATRRADLYAEVWGHRRKPTPPASLPEPGRQDNDTRNDRTPA